MVELEGLAEVAAIVVGAGAAGAVQGVLKSVMPQVAPELAGAVAGGAIYVIADRVGLPETAARFVKAFGVGVLAGSLAPLIAGAIPKWGITVGAAPTTAAAAAAGTAAKQAAAAKYGAPTKPYIPAAFR